MNIGLYFEKWWASTNNANYFSPGEASFHFKHVALEAFAEGYLLDRDLRDQEPLALSPCSRCGRTTLNAECPNHIVPGVNTFLSPRNTDAAQGETNTSLRERIRDEVRGIMPPMLVDEKGFVKLSNVDVERIAKATVDHMYEIKALAATQRLQEQNRQAREYRDAVAVGRPSFAVVEALKKAASDRVDVALRESENTIANILKIHGYGAYDHVIKFEFVISALKNLVAAIKILKERI